MLCDHGYFLHDCALCLKAPGECDYGSCTAPASTRVPTLDAASHSVERRPMCARHGRVAA